MADASASFSVDIEETGGDDAASSLEALRDKIASDTAALREMQTALRNLKGSTTVSAETFKSLREQIDAQKTSIAQAQEKFVTLGGSFEKAKKPDLGTQEVADLGGALEKIPGPIGDTKRKTNELGEAFKKLGAAGPYVAIAVAVALITAAVVVATAAVLKWGISMADAARNAALATAGIAASSDSLANLASMLPGVAAKTGLATTEISKLAEGLDAAGVSAKDMPDALRAVSMATAGGATSAFLSKLNADLKAGKKSAKELADEVEAKFGGIVAKKMLSLDSQAARLKANIGGTFGGLKIEGLLGNLSKLVALFDQNTASGRAMKALFERLVQPLVDGLTALIPKVQIAFLYVVLYSLKAYNAIKPFGAEIKLLAQIMGGLLLAAIVIVGASLLIAFLPVIIVIAAVVVAIYVVIKVLELLGAAWDAIVGGASSAWDSVKAAFNAAIAWLGGLDLSSLAGDLIQGLIDGIAGKVGAVVATVTNLGKSALSALKSVWDSHSPSRAFGRIGDTAPQGVIGSLEQGTSDVEAAAADMGRGALRGANTGMSDASAGPSAGARAGGGKVEITIHIHTKDEPQSIAAAARDAVLELFEGEAVMAGAF